MWTNLGSAILIIGTAFLHLAYGLDIWVTVGFCLFGLGTWLITDDKVKDLAKQKIRAEIALLEAKTDYYHRKKDSE